MRIPCTAREIAAAVGGKLLQDGDTARRVSTDSRDILTGDLFVPLVGERLDMATLVFAVAVMATVYLGKRMPVHAAGQAA